MANEPIIKNDLHGMTRDYRIGVKGIVLKKVLQKQQLEISIPD